MTPWIQVYTNAASHRKTYRLAEELKIPTYAALGLMVSLWLWAAVNATDGDISGYSPRAICDAVGWKKGLKFYDALLNARLIEDDGGKMRIRNWEHYALLLMDYAENQRKKTNDRVRKFRERKKQKEEAPACEGLPDDAQTYAQGCNVTETLRKRDVTPLPNLTLPNLTYSTVDAVVEENSYGDSGDEAAATEEKKLKYLQGTLGKGVVLLSDRQISLLLDKMGLDSFDHYVDKLSDFIISKGAKVANHYETILKWWREDGGGQ